ncbi:MAG: urease accessory protein UreE [Rhizobiales bacterium]|nr:urease accessory protein UreE [Hyphomicrobiales bacterium]
MPRVIRVLPAGSADHGHIVDTLILSFDQRQAARGEFACVKGTRVEFEGAGSVRLRMGDVLILDNDSSVEIVAEPEQLLEARAADLPSLARLAWHLGDRHMLVQILPNRLRVRADATIASLLSRLGARVAAIEAPFEPEGGAYTPLHQDDHRHHGANDHHHHHSHEHDHGDAPQGHGTHGLRAPHKAG